MATIGVLTYTMPQTNNNNQRQTFQSINAKTKSNISNINNNNNNKTNNNNETSSDSNSIMPEKQTKKQNLLVLRKKQKIQPLTEAQTNVVSVNTITTSAIQKLPSKIAKIASLDTIAVSSGKVATVKNKGSTLPLAVARRNARERNRVKQVNNGFAALRERIPDEVAECFETHGSRRDATKKLSKVETLRMAVEYIRSLEKVLEIDSENKHYPTIIDDTSSSTTTTTTSPLSKLNQSPLSVDNNAIAQSIPSDTVDNTAPNFEDDSNMIQENSSIAEITIINGHQYIRIPGTNTYHLLSAALYQNEENIQPLSGNNHQTLSTLLQQQQQQHQLINYDTQSILMDNTSQIMTIANMENDIKPELYLLTNNPSPFDSVLTLKTEITDDDILLNSQPLSTESMIENMEWWDSTVTHSNNSDDLSS